MCVFINIYVIVTRTMSLLVGRAVPVLVTRAVTVSLFVDHMHMCDHPLSVGLSSGQIILLCTNARVFSPFTCLSTVREFNV